MTGSLLGGRVQYRQAESGFRTGIEPVLLAAAVAARGGDSVLEAGTGAGAGLLCLAARVPGIVGTGIERNVELAALASDNFRANGLDQCRVEAEDLLAWQAPAPFDHAMANPPWHSAGSTRSPDALRDAAKAADPDLLRAWIRALATALRPRGTLTLVLPAALLTAAAASLACCECGAIALLPLWPRTGSPAKLMLLQAVRGGRGPDRILPGLVLHRPEGGYTEAADAILRDGAALPISRGDANARVAHGLPPGSRATGGGSVPAARPGA